MLNILILYRSMRVTYVTIVQRYPKSLRSTGVTGMIQTLNGIIYSFILSFIYSFIYSFIHSFNYSFFLSFIPLFNHSFIHSSIHSSIHSFHIYIQVPMWSEFVQALNAYILMVNEGVHYPVMLSIHLLIHPFIQMFILFSSIFRFTCDHCLCWRWRLTYC